MLSPLKAASPCRRLATARRFEKNQPLAHYMVGRVLPWLGASDRDDASQEALDALWRAADGYDGSKSSAQFHTYACRAIYHALIRYEGRRRSHGLVQVQYVDKQKRLPQEVRMHRLFSGEQTCLTTEDREEVEEVDAADDSARLLGLVDGRTETFMRAHYCDGRTLEDIAMDHGITKERVRQIIRDGVKRIRQVLQIDDSVKVGVRNLKLGQGRSSRLQ